MTDRQLDSDRNQERSRARRRAMTDQQRQEARRERDRVRTALRREAMTEEERDAQRLRNRERNVARREAMTDEEREAVMLRNRERNVARREAMTAEEREAERLQNVARREAMTAEEHEAERLQNVARREAMTDEEREAERLQNVERRGAMTDEENEAERLQNVERDRQRRANPERRDAENSRARQRWAGRTADQRTERNEQVRENRVEAADGPYRLAQPANMPRDSYFEAQFERNPVAAQAFFWGRSYNWLFADWRNVDFTSLDIPTAHAIAQAMEEEGMVQDDDVIRCVSTYTSLMDPGQPVLACVCCGILDVPVTGERPGRDTAHIAAHLRNRIRQYIRLALEITPGVLHGDLGPLVYTVEQNATFDQHVPPHVEDTPLNRELWQRYRRVHSNFEACLWTKASSLSGTGVSRWAH